MLRRLLLPLLIATLLAASCGDDGGDAADESVDTNTSDASDPVDAEDSDPDPATSDPADDDTTSDDTTDDETTDADPTEPLTASSRGITEDTIHIGVAVPDVSNFTNAGDIAGRYEAVAADVNAAGGIIGRQIELHIAEWDLLDTVGFDAACTELTQDVEVAVVISRTPANFGDMTCFTLLSDHLVFNGIDLVDGEIAQSSDRLMSVLSDRFSALLGGLGELADELDGAQVAITAIAEADGEALAGRIEDRLTELGVETVATTLSTIGYSEDPAGSLAEQDNFAEQWRAAGATHVIALGNAAPGAAYAIDEASAQDELVLITGFNATRVLDSLNADLASLQMLGVAAPDIASIAEAGELGVPECIDIIEAAGHGPVIPRPDEEADELNALPSTINACASFEAIEALFTAAGPNPTQDDLAAVIAGGLEFEMTAATSASFGPGKPYLRDDAGVPFDWNGELYEFVSR